MPFKFNNKPIVLTSLAALLIAGVLTSPIQALADENWTTETVITNVNARNDGEWVSRKMTMELTDKRGKTRTRHTQGYRRYYGDEKRSVLFYSAPASVKGTGFLTYDYPDVETDDDQWLYLPALRKIRRISSSDRGDYFLGTDLTYEDIKKEGKLSTQDYTYEITGEAEIDEVPTLVLEGHPKSDDIAKELGYSRVKIHIDPKIWMARKAEMWDVNGNPLKVVNYQDIRKINDIWSTHIIKVENLKTRHKTVFTFDAFDYQAEVKDKMFEQRNLKRGG